MPNHNTHEFINIVVIIPTCILLYQTFGIVNTIEFALGFIFSTYFLNPDLDINSKPYNRWKAMKILWWPYKRFIKHRGKSHHPLWGPLSLISYAALLLFPIFYFINLPSHVFIIPLIGIIISIELHILADNIL